MAIFTNDARDSFELGTISLIESTYYAWQYEKFEGKCTDINLLANISNLLGMTLRRNTHTYKWNITVSILH